MACKNCLWKASVFKRGSASLQSRCRLEKVWAQAQMDDLGSHFMTIRSFSTHSFRVVLKIVHGSWCAGQVTPLLLTRGNCCIYGSGPPLPHGADLPPTGFLLASHSPPLTVIGVPCPRLFTLVQLSETHHTCVHSLSWLLLLWALPWPKLALLPSTQTTCHTRPKRVNMGE